MPTTRVTQPLLLRGSLITLSRRCGKPNCHCRDGEPHPPPPSRTASPAEPSSSPSGGRTSLRSSRLCAATVAPSAIGTSRPSKASERCPHASTGRSTEVGPPDESPARPVARDTQLVSQPLQLSVIPALLLLGPRLVPVHYTAHDQRHLPHRRPAEPTRA